MSASMISSSSSTALALNSSHSLLSTVSSLPLESSAFTELPLSTSSVSQTRTSVRSITSCVLSSSAQNKIRNIAASSCPFLKLPTKSLIRIYAFLEKAKPLTLVCKHLFEHYHSGEFHISILLEIVNSCRRPLSDSQALQPSNTNTSLSFLNILKQSSDPIPKSLEEYFIKTSLSFLFSLKDSEAENTIRKLSYLPKHPLLEKALNIFVFLNRLSAEMRPEDFETFYDLIIPNFLLIPQKNIKDLLQNQNFTQLLSQYCTWYMHEEGENQANKIVRFFMPILLELSNPEERIFDIFDNRSKIYVLPFALEILYNQGRTEDWLRLASYFHKEHPSAVESFIFYDCGFALNKLPLHIGNEKIQKISEKTLLAKPIIGPQTTLELILKIFIQQNKIEEACKIARSFSGESKEKLLYFCITKIIEQTKMSSILKICEYEFSKDSVYKDFMLRQCVLFLIKKNRINQAQKFISKVTDKKTQTNLSEIIENYISVKKSVNEFFSEERI